MEKIFPAGVISQTGPADMHTGLGINWMPQGWKLSGAFVLLYLLLDWLSVAYTWPQPGIAPWNPQLGVAMAALIVFGMRFVPVFVCAVLLARLVVEYQAVPIAYVLLEAVCVSAGYSFAAYLLARRLHFQARIRSLTDLLWALVICSIAPLAVGVTYYSALLHAGLIELTALHSALASVWIGDVLGVVTVLPLLLFLASASGRRQLAEAFTQLETFLQLAATLALLILLFKLADPGPVTYYFMMFLPLIWVAIRRGLLGASLAMFVVMAGLIVLIQIVDSAANSLFGLQARVLVLAITALVLGVVVDERRRVQTRLQQSMRLAAAGEMAAALAHELNQPLTALVGYGKACQLMLTRERMDKAELSKTVDKATAQAQRIAVIVARLRDFLRSGKMNLERIDVGELVEGVRASVAPAFEADNVKLEGRVAHHLDAVHIDRVEAEIVLRNLLTNALESIREANASVRAVTVEAMPEEHGFVRISVIDSGPGISPEISSRLFSPFATSKSHGMGMGLAVSRAIVETHGGRLWADSSAQGIFHMTLPVFERDFDDEGR
jgi:two-component system sensor kinase FixL